MNNISITENEQELFSFLVQIAQTEKIVLRVAGGWVRDKLMGLPSHDIDIAVEGCTGLYFAELVQRNLPTSSQHSIGVIQQNPERSKNLETATTKVFGYQIDFCGLRKEIYSDDSRVPVIQAAGPEEDSLRRDFRCNALFYNLNRQIVEDFTGGIEDLNNKILQTPLDPISTLSEDPLRALRALRFAVQLNFSLSPSLVEALNNPLIANRLQIVARARFQAEVIKAFQANFARAVQLFCAFPGIFAHVFTSLLGIDCAQLIDLIGQYVVQVQEELLVPPTPNQCVILGFHVISAPICARYSTITVNLANIDNFKNQKLKQLSDSPALLVPFVCCAQSLKTGQLTKEFSEYVVQLQKMEFLEQVYALLKADPEVIELLKCFKQFKSIFDQVEKVYTNGMGIFTLKVSVDVRKIAEKTGTTNKAEFQELKNKCVKFLLKKEEFPNVTGWEDEFVREWIAEQAAK
ncbi:Poly(A)_polymerase [Hexamita inflata]|uniref:Poly(A) polymerase n=1 Tax=Hexamita inflata TaxID=28002 RepID=A0AA86V2N3_9EUKA|nr:Poly(A) polymerase [Hexamita inflata]